MAVRDDFDRILRQQAATDGPTIPSIAVAQSLAETLGDIRNSSPSATRQFADEPTIDWNTPEMDDAPISMAISGPAYEDNPIWYVNTAFERLTGYTETEVCGGNLRLLQGPKTAAEPIETLREALDIWEPTIVELDNYRADGTVFRNRIALAPIADETGTISNWVGFQEDVTHR